MKVDKSLESSKELCRIIKECARSNVREFSLDNLSIKFGNQDQVPNYLAVETKPSEQVVRQMEDDSRKQLSFENVQRDLEEMKLSDPLAYEQLIGVDPENETS